MFDQHGHVFVVDLGLIKALGRESPGKSESALTRVGKLVGTLNYLAPEIVMGSPASGRSDQYSLALTVHEVLTGRAFMKGPTPSATMVNQTKLIVPALVDVVPGVPRCLSDAVVRGLAKNPRERFESCGRFAREALADVPGPASRRGEVVLTGKVSRGEPGKARCPACRYLPAGGSDPRREASTLQDVRGDLAGSVPRGGAGAVDLDAVGTAAPRNAPDASGDDRRNE